MEKVISKASHGPSILRGLIVPVDWDENGRVTAVAISDFYEEEYLIDRKDKGEELKDLVRQEVRLKGVVRQSKGRKMITVWDYSLIRPEAAPSA